MRVILVIENMINRKIANRMISSFADDIIEVSYVSEVPKIIKNKEVDLVFMEVFMKGEDEIRETKALRKKYSKEKLPIYALTSEKIRSKVFNGTLDKPLQIEQLTEVFENYKTQNDIFNINEFESFYADKSIRNDILNTFLEEEESDVSRMKDAFKSKDNDQVYQAVHYMKGTFSYLKANKIFGITKEMCDMSKNGEYQEVLDMEQKLFDAYYELLAEIKNYMK